MSSLKTLILGGTTEASQLAKLLADDKRFAAQISLAGVTENPKPLALPTRIGGFGGVDGLVAFLEHHETQALVDATHPFASQMSNHAMAAARVAGIPHLVLQRGPWVAGPGDQWQDAPTLDAAAEALGPETKSVFLTIGRKDLVPFKAQPQHSYLIRSVDPPPADVLPPDVTVITAMGPFNEAAERALLRDHGIEVIVTKNSGGTATGAKLVAARALGIPVIMVRRPMPPDGVVVATPEEALTWLEAQHHEASSKS